RYLGVPAWARPPGGLSRRGRREGVASHPLADRRRPRVNLRPRAVPARLLRVRDRLPSGPTRLHRHLHAGLLGRVGLVLLGPGAVLFVPDGARPGPRLHAQLSCSLPEPAAAAVPVVLAPRRTAVRAALQRPMERGRLRLATEFGALRGPHNRPDVRPCEGSVRPEGGPRQRVPPRDQRGEPAAERFDGCGPRRLHPVLRRRDVLLLPPRAEDDEPPEVGRELVPTGRDYLGRPGVRPGESVERPVRPLRRPQRHGDRPRLAGLGVRGLVDPTLASAFCTGAGYFVQTKVVTTIAEDQSPGMSQIILSFGVATFGVSLAAIAYLLWQVPRRRDPAYSLVTVWAFAAVFMAITAARFIFDASPAFAISAGFAINQVLVRADFAGMRRTYRSLAEGSWRNAVRKSVKVRHILAVLGIVFLVVLPNVWWAIDASIPFELKSHYDQQVANLLPSFLRAPAYNPNSGTFYFGAFGYSVPKPTDYYPAAWQWFATQDAATPPELRPAFLSWWDYGFEAVDRGVHPTVADNFQNGYQLPGQFITAQNETDGIALLVIRLLEGDFAANNKNFRPAVTAALESAGVSSAVVRNVFLHRDAYVSVVLSDPTTFGLWAPDLQPTNAAYVFLTNLIAGHLTENSVVSLYHAIRDVTGWNIGYFAVDSRLFPISASNTGIFYAPVKLSDHRVLNLPDGRVLPIDFFQIFATTQNAQNIPLQLVQPGDQVSSTTIVYQPAFYNSMFYRAYIGYAPKDLNSTDTGIPGFSRALQANPPVPAWNLTHWRVVYRTAYYN